MSIKKCLEDRVRQCTEYPGCTMYRVVFYMWDENDADTDAFCRRLGLLNCGKAKAVPFKKSVEAMQILNDEIKKCYVKIEEGEMVCSQGIFILLIGKSDEICKYIQGNSIVEFCRLIDSSKWQMDDFSRYETNGYHVEWRVRDNDVNAVAALLLHAAYSPELLYTNISAGPRYIFKIVSSEYNAVREDLCNYSLALLNKQLERSEHGSYGFVHSAAGKKCIREILSKCPRPEYLPVTGYEKLKRRLEGQVPLTVFSFFKKRKPIQTDLRTGDVLCVLQEMEKNISGSEWMRKEAVEKVLPELCKVFIDENKDSVLKLVQDHFSLYDIYYLLAEQLEIYSESIRGRIEKTEKDLDDVLENKFHVVSLELEDVFAGLGTYFELWSKYMEACTEHIFWHCVADFVQSVKHEVREDYEELRTAREILNNFKIRFWNQECSFSDPGSFAEKIFNEGSLRSRINSKFSYAAFSEKDVIEIMKAIDRDCLDTRDYHVDLKKRPEIHFIFNEELERSWKEEKRNFSWKLHPVSYIPKSVFLALKIYVYFEEEQDSEL